MASLIVTETQLKRLARNSSTKFEFNAKGFILLSFGRSGQHHIRLDLEKYENGRYNRMATPTSYEFQLSSFHIKREAYYSREEQDYDYLYFALCRHRRVAAGMGLSQDRDAARWLPAPAE